MNFVLRCLILPLPCLRSLQISAILVPTVGVAAILHPPCHQVDDRRFRCQLQGPAIHAAVVQAPTRTLQSPPAFPQANSLCRRRLAFHSGYLKKPVHRFPRPGAVGSDKQRQRDGSPPTSGAGVHTQPAVSLMWSLIGRKTIDSAVVRISPAAERPESRPPVLRRAAQGKPRGTAPQQLQRNGRRDALNPEPRVEPGHTVRPRVFHSRQSDSGSAGES